MREDVGNQIVMTSRERVTDAINFRAPDRPPIDMDLSLNAYCALLEFLRIPGVDIPAPSTAMEVLPEPAVMSSIGVDIVSLKPGKRRLLPNSSRHELPENTTDGWGVYRRLIPNPSGAYYEVVSHPLAGAGRAELETYPWPECNPDCIDEELRARARAIYEGTDLALTGRFGGPILEIASGLLGMEEWYTRLVADPDFIEALLDRIASICTRRRSERN